MAACHVVHRLVCLDDCRVVGTEAVRVACRLLTGLYRGTVDGSGVGDGDDGGQRSRGSDGGRPETKAKIAPPRWGATPSYSGGSCADDRAGRQRRALACLALTQQSRGRRKRSDSADDSDEDDSTPPPPSPLPRIGDVLCVNLLRLLEGAAAARLRRGEGRRPRVPGGGGGDASAAAARVLAEVRSSAGPELAAPVDLDGAAGFYAREMAGARRGRGRSSPLASEGDDRGILLLPGAKIMLRQRMYELANGLSLYEG